MNENLLQAFGFAPEDEEARKKRLAAQGGFDVMPQGPMPDWAKPNPAFDELFGQRPQTAMMGGEAPDRSMMDAFLRFSRPSAQADFIRQQQKVGGLAGAAGDLFGVMGPGAAPPTQPATAPLGGNVGQKPPGAVADMVGPQRPSPNAPTAIQPGGRLGGAKNAIEQLLPPTQPSFQGSQLLPGLVTDDFLAAHPGYNPARPWANSTDPMERIKQLFIDQQANAPNMGWDQSRAMLAGQLGSFNEAMQRDTQRDIARETNISKILESDLKYSPKALAGQSLLTMIGALGGSGRLDPASIQRAVGASQEVGNALNGVGSAIGGGGVPSPGGHSKLGDIVDVDAFLSQQAGLLPKQFSVGGGMDVHGKMIPGAQGALENFGANEAGQLMAALAGSKLDSTGRREAINRLMQSQAGGQIRNALIQQAAQDELAAANPAQTAPRMQAPGALQWFKDTFAPRGQGGPGQLPGSYTLAGTPFEYQVAPKSPGGNFTSNLGTMLSRRGNPYDVVVLPNGARVPIDLSGEYSGKFNPLSPNQKLLEQQREQRRSLNKDLYEALGLQIR